MLCECDIIVRYDCKHSFQASRNPYNCVCVNFILDCTKKLIFCFFPPLLNTGEEDEEDGDYTFGNSYSALVDHLKKDLQIEINTPIASVIFSNTDQGE